MTPTRRRSFFATGAGVLAVLAGCDGRESDGAADPRWSSSKPNSELGRVKGSDVEVVRMDGLVT